MRRAAPALVYFRSLFSPHPTQKFEVETDSPDYKFLLPSCAAGRADQNTQRRTDQIGDRVNNSYPCFPEVWQQIASMYGPFVLTESCLRNANLGLN